MKPEMVVEMMTDERRMVITVVVCVLAPHRLLFLNLKIPAGNITEP